MDRLYFNVLMVSLFLLVGCSSLDTNLPKVSKSYIQGQDVKLLSLGHVLIMQKVNLRRGSCNKAKQLLRIKLRSQRTKQLMSLKRDCHFKKGYLTVTSFHRLKAGKYEVDIQNRNPRKFIGKPILSARYINPDFHSEDDREFFKAKELKASEPTVGSVYYTLGDRTDWFQVKGKNSKVTINLGIASKSRKFKAQLYRMGADAKLNLLTTIYPDKSKTARLNMNDLYVKVISEKASGKSEYVLTRVDGTNTHSKKVPVIDYYRVSDSVSMLLLRATKGVKVDQVVQVYGKNARGKSKSLGTCLVTQVDGEHANCSLSQPPQFQVSEFKAHIKVEG